MAIKPILSSLAHHKLTAFLLVLQVAVTCAIVSNIAFVVMRRIERIHVVTGLDEDTLSLVGSSNTDKNANVQAREATDLAALRAIAGVQQATALDQVPLGEGESIYGLCTSKEAMDQAMASMSMNRSGCAQISTYQSMPGAVSTLGLKLSAGRDFTPQDYVTDSKQVAAVIVTRAMAERLFHGESPLGKVIFTGARTPIRVVGVVETLVPARLQDGKANDEAMLWPSTPAWGDVIYVLRSAPGDRDRILRQARDVLMAQSHERIVRPSDLRTYETTRKQYFQRDRTMIGLLLASGLGLLLVTAIGIAGLANFWVQQRTRQIGIRRAIGATQADILRYFQTENLLIVGIGVLLGLLLAAVLSQCLMTVYELPRLPLSYLAAGAIGLCVLGQLAVFGPARRAASVPPIVATRS